MLHDFLIENRVELAARCRGKVAQRTSPASLPPDLEHGVPVLLGQLVQTLRAEQVGGAGAALMIGPDIGTSAASHGNELLRRGFTVEQVVHDYGDLCQAVTELAHEQHQAISVEEFHTFNRCLDNAIAEAVTEFCRGKDRDTAEATAHTTSERLSSLARAFRHQLNTATLAFGAIKNGSVALAGATGTLLDRSLTSLRDLIDYSLADMRLIVGHAVRRQPIAIDELVTEVRIPTDLDARAHGIAFTSAIEPGLVIEADREMMLSALTMLLQNALRFTRPSGNVTLTARAVVDRVLITVEDSCGGLAAAAFELMFVAANQRSDDHVGVGLSISRRAIEANGGSLEVRNLPGSGCMFTIDLPRALAAT